MRSSSAVSVKQGPKIADKKLNESTTGKPRISSPARAGSYTFFSYAENVDY